MSQLGRRTVCCSGDRRERMVLEGVVRVAQHVERRDDEELSPSHQNDSGVEFDGQTFTFKALGLGGCKRRLIGRDDILSSEKITVVSARLLIGPGHVALTANHILVCSARHHGDPGSGPCGGRASKRRSFVSPTSTFNLSAL